MKKQSIAKAAALALLSAAVLAATPAFAGSTLTASSTLNVAGVLSPGACSVAFDGGSAIDYGTLQSGLLSQTVYNALPIISKTLTVNCGGNIHAFLSTIDNRTSSVIADPAMAAAIGNPNLPPYYMFGLGSSGSAKIGSYAILIGPATVTSAAGITAEQPAVLVSSDKSVWQPFSMTFMDSVGGAFYSAGDANAGAVPVAGKTFVFPIWVKAVLNNTTNLPITSDVKLDGSTTFVVSYN